MMDINEVRETLRITSSGLYECRRVFDLILEKKAGLPTKGGHARWAQLHALEAASIRELNILLNIHLNMIAKEVAHELRAV